MSSSTGRGGGGRNPAPGGPGRHASRRPPDARAEGAKPGSDFWDRIQRGNNVTKIGNSTNPRDVAGQIAAQARAAVDCPFLQCVGPQSTNQGLKAIAIARTYLQQSDQSGDTCHPDIVMYPEFVHLTGDEDLSAISMRLAKRTRRPGVTGKEGRILKVGNQTDPKCARPPGARL
mmetsp:Transcript_5412/g.17972  ORF Transcript_5412/g.17972 Transcript_5412/m.17972 type:complete len:174 (+) Transcript_5412:53-574(+)